MDRLAKVYDANRTIAVYEYDANSQLTENTRGDITTTYEYNKLGQLETLTTTQLQEKIMQFEYEYDKIGNITAEIRTEGDAINSRTYSYDAANQLVEFTDNDYIESYTYDNAGNMLTKDKNGETTAYKYNVANQLTEQTANNQTIGYKYDANGDLREKTTGEQYSYDIQGNLTSIVGNGIDKQYSYNGNGNRLSETTDGETIYYVNDLNQRFEQVLQTYNESGEVINTYTYGVQRINSAGQDNETYIYDGRGSVVGSVSQDNVLTSYAYAAYGELMPNSPAPKVYGYNAEATDYTTGLQYLRARYYDITINRFFQEDDSRGNFVEPQTINRYIYVGNNPSNRIDPSGYGWISNIWNSAKNTAEKVVNSVAQKAKSVVKKIIPLRSKTVKETAVAVRAKVARTIERSTWETYISTNEYLALKEANQENTLKDNEVIVPTPLEPGRAGYLDGQFCYDGGQELKNQLLSEGKSIQEANSIVDSRFTAMSEDEVNERNEILDKAYEYINYKWTPTEDLTGWKDRHVYKKGKEYRGVPYSQDNRYSVEDFDASQSNSDFYSSNVSQGKVMPQYGQDCSGLVCYLWGQGDRIVRSDGTVKMEHLLSTSDIRDAVRRNLEIGEYANDNEGRVLEIKIVKSGEYNFDNAKSDDFEAAAPGDAIVKDGHIRIVVGNDGENLICIEQTEFPGFAVLC